MTVRGSDEAALRKAMHESLRGGTVLVLASISPDGVPSTALCSWVVAKGPQRLAMALDKRGAAYASIAAGSNQVALEVMADDVLLAIRGTATIEEQSMTSTPFPCALVCVDVAEIRSHMFAGIEFKGPRYLFAPGKERRKAVEGAIFEELERA
jgi:hypothetical protein